MTKYTILLLLLVVAGCDKVPHDAYSCRFENGYLQGYTTAKILHCEIHDDGSVSHMVTK